MTNPPQVSIVIPTRDRWHLLSTHALPSALGQIAVDLEVLVVDDGSTRENLAALARVEDPRVRILRNEHTPGICGARNTGVSAARGEWLAFLDDDDLWSPRKLRTQLDLSGSAPWRFGAAIVVDESLSPRSSLGLPSAVELGEQLQLGNVVPAGSSNVIVRTELVRRLGGFDEQLVLSGDWDMWLKLAEEGQPAISQEVLVATLEHPGRMFFREPSDIVSELHHLFARNGGPTRRQEQTVLEWHASEYRRHGDHARAAAIYARIAYRHRSPGNLVAAAGALLGKRGLKAASGLLQRVRGSSHLDSAAFARPVAPDWLAGYRVGTSLIDLHLPSSASVSEERRDRA
jgi:glycosyltransferase involved in cell wall biosynthesis